MSIFRHRLSFNAPKGIVLIPSLPCQFLSLRAFFNARTLIGSRGYPHWLMSVPSSINEPTLVFSRPYPCFFSRYDNVSFPDFTRRFLVVYSVSVDGF